MRSGYANHNEANLCRNFGIDDGAIDIDSSLRPYACAYADEGSQEMYRMYNPNSGEHFYTANSYERDNLKSLAGTMKVSDGWLR